MTRIPRLASVIGGRYELGDRLGEGGMAEVWQARHISLGMPVAVKLLHPRLIAKASSREHFLTEAKVMAALETRHAIRVFDFGITPNEQPYLVMELVEGETLGQRLTRERRLSPRVVARLLGQAAKGLERAHALGIVHRDFKPDNVLLTRDEDGEIIAKVGDFGVAKLLSSSRWETASEADGAGCSSARTRARDDFAGTPVYMAPEQLVGGKEASPLVDVWSFGVVAYELLTGTLPFQARDVHALGRRVAMGAHIPPTRRRSGIPKAFDAWFVRACAVDPAARFPSVRAAARELSAALGEPDGEAARSTTSAARWRFRVVGAAMTAASVAGVVSWRFAPRETPPIVITRSADAPEPTAERAPVVPPSLGGDGTPMTVPAAARSPSLGSPRRDSLPSYRTLPDDEPPRPARGFKGDPY